MSKIIKWGLVMAIAVALLIKLSLWLSVRSIVNDAVQQLSPFMDIRYGGITSSFDGRVGLEKIEINVPALRDSVRVAHAELKFNGLGELLRFKERLGEGKFPEQMAVKFKGIELEVHGPFMQQLYDTPPERSVFTAMSEVACGKVRYIGTGELLDMGYRTFETDAEFSYLFQPGAQKLTFNMTADMRDMGELRLSLGLSNMSEKPGDLRVNPPHLSSVTFELNDNQYQRKVQEYCAGKMGQSSEVYLKTAVEQFDRVLRSQRIGLDQPLLDAYAGYLKDPQSLRLELNPSEGMTWDGLQFFEAKDVLSMLRPTLLVNQQVVEPIGFAWVDPHARKPQRADELVVADRPADASRPSTPQYEFVSVASLPEYAGKRLQFITYDGAYYQGVLHKVENGKAFLSVQFGTGSAEMFLRLEKIDKVRVLF
ncbi:hypothetical protein [Pseudomonas indica]|uniref:Uncharacterized protein n=1 Tax=Pseudomonas indica TaxID=137658 RepID=A0A1G8XAR6_9PSED|nr:hypothetical protein [Pseudomonas indica]MBU3054961.1 hypothetical protein [Pseudomonas indica]SDJ87396.1 hypothetical protein SAMN05216186_103122 [Pseudomonas indica]